jgi:prevent-host-death family protein
MKLKEDIKPVTYLKNNASQLVRTVSEQGRTVTITQNGEAKAVLMDVAIYDRWKQAAILMKLIAQGEADVAAGRTLSEREAFARAERAIERASRGG